MATGSSHTPQLHILPYLFLSRGLLLLALTGDLEEPECETNPSGEVEFIKEPMKRNRAVLRQIPWKQSLRRGFGACDVLREGSWKKSQQRGKGGRECENAEQESILGLSEAWGGM